MPVIINPDVLRTGLDFPGLQQWLGVGIESLLMGVLVFIVASVVSGKGVIIKTKTN